MPRSTILSNYGEFNSQTTYLNGKIPSSSAVGERPAYDKVLSRSDVVRNKRSANGWIKPSDYLVNDDATDHWFGTTTMKVRYNSESDRYYDYDTVIRGFYGPGGLLPNFVDMSGPNENDTNRSIIECLLKVRDGKINLAQAFAERTQTADLLANRAAQVMRAYSAVRRGNFAAAFKALGIRRRKLSKDASSAWLELQYGWLPLLSDIHGAYDEITRPVMDVGHRFKSTREVSSASQKVVRTANGKQEVLVSTKNSVKTVLWFSVDNPALLAASQTGLVNPATILWELTPWSFVIDWILPVGNLLEAMTATTGLSFVGGTVTKTVRGKNVGKILPHVDSGGANLAYITSSATSTREVFRMVRSALQNPPDIGPSNLYVKNPFSTTHVANAAALWKSSRK